MASPIEIAEQLKNRVWFTRIARIYSEKRLLRNELHSQLLLMAYSVYSIALSVILLKYKPISDDAGAVMGIILSVALFGLSFHLSARNFPIRAQRFKENYSYLQGLLDRLSLLEQNTAQAQLCDELATIQQDYQKAIVSSENHSTMDDRCARFLAGEDITRKLTRWEYVCVASYTLGRYAVLTLLYLAPPILFGYMLCHEATK